MADTTPNQKNPSGAPAKKSNSNLIIIIVALVLALAVISFFVYQKSQKVQETETELLQTYERMDSISDVLSTKIAQVEELGGDVEELTKAKADLEQEKEELLNNKKYSDRRLRDLGERLEGYKELLLMKDEEIAKLENLNEQLVEENTELKTEKNQLTQTLKETEKTKEELDKKVKVASQLEAENINVIAVNSRGKEREGEFRSRQIDQLKVTFNIARNEVAPIEGKEIYIRVTDENGNAIFDVAKGSGTFVLDGEEVFYTSKQDILFDNSQQELTFIYEKGSEYEEGVYEMEIYTDGYKMGEKSFRVK